VLCPCNFEPRHGQNTSCTFEVRICQRKWDKKYTNAMVKTIDKHGQQRR
jgi:hypothetical protein